jgi:hypothetical protein
VGVAVSEPVYALARHRNRFVNSTRQRNLLAPIAARVGHHLLEGHVRRTRGADEQNAKRPDLDEAARQMSHHHVGCHQVSRLWELRFLVLGMMNVLRLQA